ncbi:MAG: hypothetical protein J0I88_04135 [Chryseobacterium sp.]|nr:hypothetical protein [Chryseobacterium sp.]OJX28952.1 MAG: hypothetical protein BGO86_02960 [Chryseobacterium sp. 36-9]
MKKLLFTLLTLGLLIPTTYSASTKNPSRSEFFAKKQKKKKASKKRKSRKSYADNGCTYNGYPLIKGKRGGCYYWAGNSKEYVDRSYCSGCN